VSLLQARDQGFDFVALVTNNAAPSKPPHEAAIVIRRDDQDIIKSPKDLEGRTVSTSTIKGLQYVMAVGAIRKAGGNDKLVKWVEVPDANVIDGLANKLFDASTMAEPYTTLVQTKGIGKVLTYHYIDVAPGLDIGAYISTRAFAQKNPGTVEAFARALKKTHAYLMADPDRARQLLGEVSHTPPEAMQKIVLPVWTQSVNEASLNILVRLLHDLGFIKGQPNVKDFVWEASAL
jgi:NitT/TauT family transport system substrate-binding protein